MNFTYFNLNLTYFNFNFTYFNLNFTNLNLVSHHPKCLAMLIHKIEYILPNEYIFIRIHNEYIFIEYILPNVPCIMEDILELVSVLSLPVGLGQTEGVAFWACQAGVPHHQKCLARSIHDSRYYGGHLGVSFSSFPSCWPRSASGRGLLGLSGKVNS